MIIELTIENFKSFRECTSISFASGTTSKLAGNVLQHPNGERFIKSMALYGPNASGKTTILDAVYAICRFVLLSTEDRNPNSRIPRFEPFALDQSCATLPTRIKLTIDLAGSRYTIDVSATAERVWNETLTVQHIARQPGRKTATRILLTRKWNLETEEYSVSLHEDLGSESMLVQAKEHTPHNRLMIGKLASMNSTVSGQIIKWFEDVDFYDMHRNSSAEDAMLTRSARLLNKNTDFATTITHFLRDADIGIEQLRVTEEKTVELVPSESDNKLAFKEAIKPTLSFGHFTEDGAEVFFRWQQESSGTLRFVALLGAVLQPNPRRRLVCIDEISASMHPDLVRRLIQIVHSSKYNPQGNQLLFTTHDTHLINPSKLLRRDQITICEKDRFGRSVTTRLDRFQDVARSDANLQKQYLQGRFGGTPEFGPTLEDVPVDDEPLEVSP